MPTLGPDRWRDVSPHLDRALDLAPQERASWLAALRAQDPNLASEIEALLEEHATLNREGFLSGEAAPLSERASFAGLRAGDYTLRSPLGKGGMGQVWLADRSDGRFEGRVAVKLLNASLIGQESEIRFRREGSLLARLRHPHIAQLLDAGMTPAGQPYLVLEHVDGEPIDIWCDARSLGVDARVRLFLDVLTAVAFAHANLVVHRDIKPPNILVGKDGRVRLLDFGIAKLLDPEGAHGAVPTREGSALTPEFAAPEQLSGGGITTATDVYALGVVLYQLLTGQHPAGPDTTTPAALIRAVMDQEPSRLSDVVVNSAHLSKEPLTEIAARRGATPGRLRRLLRGDLDNIIMKALRKNPRDRYPSVEALADDLRRHLNHEPVRARADSFVDRAIKFVRRHRSGVAAAVITGAAVLAGVTGIIVQAREARRQRDMAEVQLARAAAGNDFIRYLLGVAAPSGKRFTVGELLEQGEDLVERVFATDDALRAEMLALIGWEYVLSERWDRATPILERAAAIAEKTRDPILAARTECPLAFLRMMHGKQDEAHILIDRALAGLPETPQHDLQRAECMMRQAEFGYFDSDGDAMIRNSFAAMSLLERARGATATKKTDALASLAYGYYLAGQGSKAEETFARVLEELEETGRGRTLAAADALNNWSLLHFLGNIGRAEPLLRRVVDLRRSIEEGGTIAPTYTFNLAGALLELGRHDQAEALFEETIRVAEARGEHRIQFDAMMELAEVHIETGHIPRAEAQLDKLAPFAGHPQFNAFRQAQMAYYRGRLAQALGDEKTARSRYLQALEIFDSRKARLAMNVRALIGLSRAERALGDLAAAEAVAGRALEMAESFVEKDAPSYLVGLSLAAHGEILADRGRPEEARSEFQAAARHLERTLGADHRATQETLRRAAM